MATAHHVLHQLRAVGQPLSAAELADDLGWPRWKARNALETLRRHRLVVPSIKGNGGAIPTRWEAR